MKKIENFFILLCILVMSNGLVFAAGTEEWPTKPIEIYVGYAAGSSVDVVARMYSPIMSKELGVPVVVINKPGAGGAVCEEYIARAKPDGYTLQEGGYNLLATRPLFIDTKLTFRDFTYILSHSDFNFAFVVRKDAPWKNFRELVEYARKNTVKYVVSGAYGTPHLVMDWVTRYEKIKAVYAPYKGSGDAMPQVLGGHVDMYCGSGAATLIEAGRLKTLLQLSGEVADTAKVPRITEFYSNLPEALRLSVGCPSGLAGPKGIPAPIVQKLAKVLKKAIDDEKFRAFLKQQGRRVVVWEGEEAFKNLQEIYEAYPALLKEAGFVKK